MNVTKKTVYMIDDFETTFEPIEGSIKIKKTKEGYEIKYLKQDNNSENPRKGFFDNLGTMVCFHRRYNLGDKHNYKKDDYNSWEELKDAICRSEIVPIILPLYLYDHSGISMRTYSHGHHVAWDCGQAGYIYVTKEKIKEEYGKVTEKTIERAKQVLIGEVETYDQYIRGEVYCCVVDKYDKEKNLCDYDVVGGYFGYDYAMEALKEEF